MLALLEFIRYSLLTEDVKSSVMKFKKTNPDIIFPGNIEDIITNIDPTNDKGDYALWLLQKIKDELKLHPEFVTDPSLNNRFYQEDFPKVTDFLKKFDDLKQPKFKKMREDYKVSADINKYKTTQELIDVVKDIELEGIWNKKDRAAKFKTVEGEGKDLVAETNEYNVYKVTSVPIAMKIGAVTWTIGETGHGWCTKSSSQAIHYLSLGPLYIYETKDGVPVIQLHTQSNQFKDVNDHEINNYTPDMMEAFQKLASQDDGILLWCHGRRVEGFKNINPVEYATKTPEGAYGYLMSSRNPGKITPEISAVLQSGDNGLHLSGYYIMQVSGASDQHATNIKKYSDMLSNELIGFPSEKAFSHRIISSGDPILASRVSPAFSKPVQLEFLAFVKTKKNPAVALVTIATRATKERLDRASELIIMQTDDDESWKEYAKFFKIKITEKEAEDAVKDNLADNDIIAYVNVLSLDEIEKIFKNAGSLVMKYLKAHKDLYDKLITTKPDWAYCYCIDVLDKL